MKVSSFHVAGIALVLGGGFVGSAGAVKVLVDFGNNTSYRGVSVNPNPETLTGLYWNSLQPGLYYGPTTTPLITTTGTASPIDLGFTTPVATDSYNGPAGPTDGAPPATLVNTFTLDPALGDLRSNAAGIDYAASVGAPCKFTVGGLDVSKTYEFKFFGSHSFSTDQFTVFSVYGDADYTNLLGSASLSVRNSPNFWEPNLKDIATISGVAPAAPPEGMTPRLYLQFIGLDGEANGYLNSMEIIESSSTPSPGDANGDGHVNSLDFDIYVANYGVTSGGTFAQGDFDGNGKINTVDFNILASAFGLSTSPGLGTVVPEPASLSALAVGGSLFLRRRRA